MKISAAFLLLGLFASASVAQTMSLPGQFGVSASGAATYAIPIAVPPGTAGMSPSLSLEYNHQSSGSSGWLSSGVVGVGWSLGGLPAVGRCPRTVAQDGAIGAVNYDANDRFCLDGQRLIAISGTDGADGTEYRTEIESFSRVISHGTAGTGPAWFEVHTKSGQVLQFGNTTDSLILAQSKTTARSWGVNKVSDTKGNYFTVTYVNDTVNGQAYPSRIDYTGNDVASLAPYNSVQFVYDTNRPDVLPVYHAGSLMKTTVRLANVRTYAGAALVADYRLAYQQGSATGRSQLANVTLCDGTNSCLPATTFSWQNGVITPTVTSNAVGQDGTLSGSAAYLGDFNGDGLPDIMWDAQVFGNTQSTGARVLWTNTGAGNFSVQSNFAGQDGTLSGYAPLIGDFNRDGRSDVWWYQANNSKANGPTTKWLSAAGGGFSVTAGVLAPTVAQPVGLGDMNGDHRDDLMWYRSDTVSLTVWRTNADGSVSATNPEAPSGVVVYENGTITGFTRGADFDGDGLPDVLWLSPNGEMFALWRSNGDGTFTQIAGSDSSVVGYKPYFADFNGDGNADILWDMGDGSGRSSGQRILWIGKGDGTFSVSNNAGGLNGTLSGYVPTFGDFNGDGLADVLWMEADIHGLSTGQLVGWISKGDGTFSVISNFGGQDGTLGAFAGGNATAGAGYSPMLADFNGDGKTDILWDSHAWSVISLGGTYFTDPRSYGFRVLWLSDSVRADLITVVTTGVGATTVITYKSLTDGTVYTKDNTAVDPIVDVQMAMPVVFRVDASNGIGGTVSTGYAYVGAKTDQNGRGFLGFRQMTVTDLQTNIVQTTTYRQDYPYLNLVASDTKVLSGASLSATSNTYGSTSLGGTRYQVFLTQSVANKTDLDGSVLPTATSSYQYDAYNNATQVAVTTSDGYTKTTTNTYTNDTTNWLLGRLTASTVTSQTPLQLGQYCSLPWGGIILAGQSVAAYSAANPPVGQICSAIAQTRTCTNGSLSGSFTSQSCSLAACSLPWGGSISSGQSVTAYSTANAPADQSCSTLAQTRICTNGALSGSYTQQTCSNPCALPWGGTIASGQSVTAYSASSVGIGQSCSPLAQTRTCTNAILSGSFTNKTCGQQQRIYLSSGTSWSAPLDWNNSSNTVEVIGGGGGGGKGSSVFQGAGGGGGGGGAYSKTTNLSLTPGNSITYSVGPAGSAGTSGAGGAGGDTYFNGTNCGVASACAKGGQGGGGASGTTAGAGGVGGGQSGNTGGVGTVRYLGGNGGTSGNGLDGGSGGGGAGGPLGNGGAGGISIAAGGGGGGGGGNGGGSNGSNSDLRANGGAGGNNASGTGGGSGGVSNYSPGSAGANGGGGGGGGNRVYGGAGGAGIEWDSSHGSGGGGGGGANANSSNSGGGAGALYGGGGGGGGNLGNNGAAGAQGVIVITYTPQ